MYGSCRALCGFIDVANGYNKGMGRSSPGGEYGSPRRMPLYVQTESIHTCKLANALFPSLPIPRHRPTPRIASDTAPNPSSTHLPRSTPSILHLHRTSPLTTATSQTAAASEAPLRSTPRCISWAHLTGEAGLGGCATTTAGQTLGSRPTGTMHKINKPMDRITDSVAMGCTSSSLRLERYARRSSGAATLVRR